MTIVHHGLQALDGDYGWFGSLDSANNMLVTRAFEGYPPGVMDPFMAISLDETLPATEVLRTGKPMFVESAADRVAAVSAIPRHGSPRLVRRRAGGRVRGNTGRALVRVPRAPRVHRGRSPVHRRRRGSLRPGARARVAARSRTTQPGAAAHAARLLRAARRDRRPRSGAARNRALRGHAHRPRSRSCTRASRTARCARPRSRTPTARCSRRSRTSSIAASAAAT